MYMQQRIDYIENGNLKKVLLKMGIPAVIGMLITASYNLIDAYFVAGLGSSQFAAVTVVFPIIQIMIGVALLFGAGAGSFISRLLGAAEIEKAGQVATMSLVYGISTALIIIFGVLFYLQPILIAIGATPSILVSIKDYAVIVTASSVFSVASIIVCNIITSEGKPDVTMWIMLTGALLNIVLDPVLIYSFNLGIDGAGYATLISQTLSTILGVIFLFNKKNIIKISLSTILFDIPILKEIMKIGFPIFLYQFFTSVSMSLTNMMANPYGDDAIAAMGIMLRVVVIGFFVVFGFSKGLMPVIGINFGANKHERVKDAIAITHSWGLKFCLVFSVCIIFGSEFIAQHFVKSDSTTLIDIATKALIYNGIAFIFFAYQNVYASAFLAMGKATEGGILSLARQGIFFMPLILILPHFLGIEGVLLAQPIADFLTVGLTWHLVQKTPSMKQYLK